MKKYSIEVPIYSRPLNHLIELNQLKDIEIVLYGGVPNSPLNGGRCNYILDGLILGDKPLYRLTAKQLSRALANFYETVAQANQNSIAFRLAFTNMFVTQEELNEENMHPVKWLVESGQKHGVRNGIILNNPLLENFLRQKYGGQLTYVSSCTKYVSPDRVLSPRETKDLYLKDSGKYDFVCLTPQDSRRENLIREVLPDAKGKIIAICNSYCSNNCNSYYHYENASHENKKSLLTVSDLGIVRRAFSFIIPRATTCSAFRQPFHPVDVKKISAMQISAGITHFKFGRGFGTHLLDDLVALLR